MPFYNIYILKERGGNMEDIFLSCDLVYNKILNFYIEKMKKEGKTIDLLNFDIKYLRQNNLFDKKNYLNKKSFLKKTKKEKRKFFLSSILNMPFVCHVKVIIPILNDNEIIKIKLTNDDIKTILNHYYKDCTITFSYYTLKEVLDDNDHIDTIRPFKGVFIIKKNIDKIDQPKVLKKNLNN